MTFRFGLIKVQHSPTDGAVSAWDSVTLDFYLFHCMYLFWSCVSHVRRKYACRLSGIGGMYIIWKKLKSFLLVVRDCHSCHTQFAACTRLTAQAFDEGKGHFSLCRTPCLFHGWDTFTWYFLFSKDELLMNTCIFFFYIATVVVLGVLTGANIFKTSLPVCFSES